MFLGCTLHANLMKRPEYTHMAPVMFTEMDSGDLVKPSVMPASTKPQFATGPLHRHLAGRGPMRGDYYAKL